MIPMIGIMIGFYIITRMLSFITRKGDFKESWIVIVFAVITILIAITGLIDFIVPIFEQINEMNPNGGLN